MEMQYKITDGPFPIEDYVSTIKVSPVGDNSSKLTWECEFTSEETVKTDMENLFGEASASMLAIVGLAILVGALVGWFASRSQSRARIDAAEFALKDKTAERDAVKHELQQRDEQINGFMDVVNNLQEEIRSKNEMIEFYQ